MVKFKYHEERTTDYPGGLNLITWLISLSQLWSETWLEERLESFLMAVLEMEPGGPMPRKYRQPLEAEKKPGDRSS